jgi:hypothetical protein
MLLVNIQAIHIARSSSFIVRHVTRAINYGDYASYFSQREWKDYARH